MFGNTWRFVESNSAHSFTSSYSASETKLLQTNRLGSVHVNLGDVFGNIWIWKYAKVCGAEFCTFLHRSFKALKSHFSSVIAQGNIDIGLVPDLSNGGHAATGSNDGGREARVQRYKDKRRTRLFSKKIRYEVRKLNAERRPRMKVSNPCIKLLTSH